MISDAAGDARNTTAPATSIGSPILCNAAIRSTTSALNTGSLRHSLVPGVLMNVGATAFTVFWWHSTPIPSAALQTQPGNWRLTMRPYFCGIMNRAETAKVRDSVMHGAMHLIEVGHIHLQREGAAAQRPDFVDQPRIRMDIAQPQSHVRPGVGERQRDGTTKAAGRSCDERYLIRKGETGEWIDTPRETGLCSVTVLAGFRLSHIGSGLAMSPFRVASCEVWTLQRIADYPSKRICKHCAVRSDLPGPDFRTTPASALRPNQF